MHSSNVLVPPLKLPEILARTVRLRKGARSTQCRGGSRNNAAPGVFVGVGFAGKNRIGSERILGSLKVHPRKATIAVIASPRLHSRPCLYRLCVINVRLYRQTPIMSI